jgi:diguanylate cyclase (GGDEF)-like protein/PAS domain S-box-containing protein
MENADFKILLIDNSRLNIESFTTTVNKYLPKTKVLSALSGSQGIALAKDNDPDVIIIDISISDKDALSISQILKKDVDLQLTPVLLLTDLESDREKRLIAAQAGTVDAFLCKPLEETILITQLKAMVKVKERNIMMKAYNLDLEKLVMLRTRKLKEEVVKREKTENALQESEDKFKSYIEMAPMGIFVVNAMGRYTDVNEMACKLTGYNREELLSLSIIDFLLPSYAEKGLAGFNKIKTKGFVEDEYKVRKKDGQENWISLSGIKVNDDCMVAFCSDITERKNKQQQIEYLTYHDVLTGVVNRFSYEQHLRRLDTKRYFPLSLIICDFNGLKLINDTLGHSAGDIILVETAKLLNEFVRKGDIFARTGGDEFYMLLPKTNNEDAHTIIKRISTACNNKRIDVFKHSIKLSLSLGYATKTAPGESFSLITKTAEELMYRNKLLARDSYHSSLITSLKNSLYERSHETKEHASRLVELSAKIGNEINLSEDQKNKLKLLSELHDIGKISIDNRILIKPGKLTDEEWLEMKKHPAIGYRILLASPELKSIAELVLAHHERWDGKGYPQGLAGEDIPLLSRIISVVDAFDAMTEDRVYRKALSRQTAINEIEQNSGTQFDPQIASVFLKIIR